MKLIDRFFKYKTHSRQITGIDHRLRKLETIDKYPEDVKALQEKIGDIKSELSDQINHLRRMIAPFPDFRERFSCVFNRLGKNDAAINDLLEVIKRHSTAIQKFHKEIDHLKNPNRSRDEKIIYLRFRNRLSMREIAEQVKCSKSTVCRVLHKYVVE